MTTAVATSSGTKVPSELVVVQKWRDCRANALKLSSYGAGIGALSFLIRGRLWFKLGLIGLGAGAGFGIAFAECSQSFNRPTLYDPAKIKLVRPVVPAPPKATEESASTESSS
ncbi:Mitochondrial inner membrane organizing system component [Balamuthia mandrillaris]